MDGHLDEADCLLRIEQVLELIPVSRSNWYAGMRTELYPRGFKLGPRMRVWRLSEILDLIEKLGFSKK